MKYGWCVLLALLLPGGVAIADDSTLARVATGTARISLYIPAQFEATLDNESVCVQSTGADPYRIAPGDTSPSSSNHCIAMKQIPIPDAQPLTLWVRPE